MKKDRELLPLLYSRRECAQVLGCGLNKVDDAIRQGTLKSFKWGGDRKVHVKDLDAFAWNLRQTGIDAGWEV